MKYVCVISILPGVNKKWRSQFGDSGKNSAGGSKLLKITSHELILQHVYISSEGAYFKYQCFWMRHLENIIFGTKIIQI